MLNTKEPIVLYDGDCGFCNRSVAFILKHDYRKQLHFASIQSEHAQRLFAEYGWPQPDLSTFYLIENGKKYEKSTAGLKLMNYFKFPASWGKIGWVAPRFLRDGIYTAIAKRRKRIFKSYCVVPSKEDQVRFID